MRNVQAIVNPENIYYFKKNGAFFLGDWARIIETNVPEPENLISQALAPGGLELNSQSLAAEIKSLAFALLEMKKVDVQQLKSFQSIPTVRESTYYHEVRETIAEGFSNLQEPKELAERLRKLVERMFSRDLKNLPNLDEFKIKEDKKIPVPQEESKANPTIGNRLIKC